MSFMLVIMAILYLVSLALYVEILVDIFEEDKDLDKELYALCIGAGVLAYIYFALIKLDYMNMIFVGLYLVMFLGTETSSHVSKRIEEEGE